MTEGVPPCNLWKGLWLPPDAAGVVEAGGEVTLEGAGGGEVTAGGVGTGELASCILRRRSSICSSIFRASSSSCSILSSLAFRSSMDFLWASSRARRAASSGSSLGSEAGSGTEVAALRGIEAALGVDLGLGGGGAAFFIALLMGAGGAGGRLSLPPPACSSLAFRAASRSSCCFSACLAFSSASCFSLANRSSTLESTLLSDPESSGGAIPKARILAANRS